MRAQRFDAGSLASPKQLPNGFLRADAYLTRTGVFRYRNADGTERREYRPPDVVFSEDSLDTLRMTALTMGHPLKPVTADNARGLSIGSVGQDVRRDGERVRATITVTDGESIAAMKRGRRQISCGYWADVENTPGVTDDGEEYDAIQRTVTYNHVAVVDAGRAGPDVAARLDEATGVDKASWDSAAVMVVDENDHGFDSWRDDSPYSLKRDGAAWLVVKCDGGKVLGVHEDRAAATLHLDALVAAAAGLPVVDNALAGMLWTLMHEKGLTVGELATAAAVGTLEMESILSGLVVLTGGQIEALALLLDTPADALKDLLNERQREQADGEETMKFKITLDGVPHELEASESAQAALLQAIARASEKSATDAARADAAEEKIATVAAAHAASLAAEKARADAAEEKAAALALAVTEASSPEAIAAVVSARVSLEKTTARVCGDSFDVAGKTDGDLRRAVVLKLAPAAEAKLDAGDDAYLLARFDQAVESLTVDSDAGNDSLARARAASNPPPNPIKLDTVDQARADAAKRSRERWKQPLAASKDSPVKDLTIAG